MKIMAVDFGESRTGLAVCDKAELLASPAGVIHEKDFEKTLKLVAEAAENHTVEEIVIGYPRNMNGSAGERAMRCEYFSERLAELTGLSAKLWDERSTTVSAQHYLINAGVKGKKKNALIDAVAATIILESYLEYRKNHK